GGGGGIAVQGQATIRNTTITGNSGAQGAGVFIQSGSAVTLSSTIVAGNTGGDVAGAPAAASNNNLVGNSQGITPGTLSDGVNGNQLGHPIIPIDPRLGLLQNNGGPTRTHMPLPGSPAIDKGVANGFTTDQRGLPRVAGPAADVGAVEV